MLIDWLFGIDESFKEFILQNKFLLEKIYEEVSKVSYCPKPENVLRCLRCDVKKIKVIIIGQDPYFNYYNGEFAATGRAYEVGGLDSFKKTYKQVSLKNILRLIYKSYHYKQISYNDLKKEFDKENFIKDNPKKWFDNLERQGVLFLNAALTTKVNEACYHFELWQDFIINLLEYINEKNESVIYFIWGKFAKRYLCYLKEKKVYISRHPMMCSDKYEDDFMKNNCFFDTKKIIDWLGNV